MFAKLGLERRDFRNLAIVVAIMGPILFFLADGPVVPRFIATVVVLLIMSVIFFIVTIILKWWEPWY